MSEKAGLSVNKFEVREKGPAASSAKANFSQTADMNSPVEQILHLQRTIGNQAVTRLIQSGVLQAKLTIGQPDDIYEQEANRAAEQVMRMRDEYSAYDNVAKTISKKSPDILRLDNNNTGTENAYGSTRHIESNLSSCIHIGECPTYTLVQHHPEFFAPDYSLTYQWKIYNSNNEVLVEQITNGNFFTASAINPGSYKIEVVVLNNDEPTDLIFSYNQDVYFERRNTELDMLSVGNFDFLFDGSTIEITVRVKFLFEDSIAEQDRIEFRERFNRAIQSYWINSGYGLNCTGSCTQAYIPININLIEVTDESYHKLIDVEGGSRRENVISDINLHLNSTERTIAHEFGHVLGLYDEYNGGWFENHMFWHDNGQYQSDTSALMNVGNQLRDRYFEHFQSAAQSVAPQGCIYTISSTPPAP
jgi:hypothetical protein